MKKVVFSLCLLLAVAVAGLPFANGIIAEKMVRQLAENATAMYARSGYDLRFEILSYDRGVMGSQVRWQVDFGRLKNVYPVERIIGVETARHGFFGVESDTSLGENPWYAGWVAQRRDGKDPLAITTRYSFFGPVRSKVTLAPFAVDVGENPVDIHALEFAASCARDLTGMSYQGNWQGMTEDEENRLGPVSFEAGLTRVTDMVWAGTGSASVSAFTARGTKGPVSFTGLDLDFNVATSQDKAFMDIEMGARMGSATINGDTFRDLALRLGVGRVDLNAYEELALLYANIANNALAGISAQGSGPDAAGRMTKRMMADSAPQLLAGLEKMLKKDFYIRIEELGITLPKGRVTGSCRLGLKKDMTLAQFYPLMIQPSHALEIFTLASSASAPGALVGANPALTLPVFPGMATGLFVPENEAFTHRAETRDGALFLNGQEVALP